MLVHLHRQSRHCEDAVMATYPAVITCPISAFLDT